MLGYCKYLLIITVSLFALKSYSQNLIPNPSFENFTSCPGAAEFSKLTPWCGLGGGEDSYNSCYTSMSTGNGIPYTFSGFQYPRTGNGIGSCLIEVILSGGQDKREYLHVRLTTTLTAGKSYCGTMYLNLYNPSNIQPTGRECIFHLLLLPVIKPCLRRKLYRL